MEAPAHPQVVNNGTRGRGNFTPREIGTASTAHDALDKTGHRRTGGSGKENVITAVDGRSGTPRRETGHTNTLCANGYIGDSRDERGRDGRSVMVTHGQQTNIGIISRDMHVAAHTATEGEMIETVTNIAAAGETAARQEAGNITQLGLGRSQLRRTPEKAIGPSTINNQSALMAPGFGDCKQ